MVFHAVIYGHYLNKIFDALRTRGDLAGALKEARRTFDDVSLSVNGGKPVVGVVGEIYTRANQFSNENASCGRSRPWAVKSGCRPSASGFSTSPTVPRPRPWPTGGSGNS